MDRLTEIQVFATVVDQSDFLVKYPDISVNIEFNNRYIELISDGFDAAIRIGELQDSTLRARKLNETSLRMVASPDYIARAGRPSRVDGLSDHNLLHYSNHQAVAVWRITSNTGEQRQIRTSGALTVNGGQSLLWAAISGLGIAYLPSFLYSDALREGQGIDVMPHLLRREPRHLSCLSTGSLYTAKSPRIYRYFSNCIYRQRSRVLVINAFSPK